MVEHTYVPLVMAPCVAHTCTEGRVKANTSLVCALSYNVCLRFYAAFASYIKHGNCHQLKLCQLKPATPRQWDKL